DRWGRPRTQPGDREPVRDRAARLDPARLPLGSDGEEPREPTPTARQPGDRSLPVLRRPPVDRAAALQPDSRSERSGSIRVSCGRPAPPAVLLCPCEQEQRGTGRAEPPAEPALLQDASPRAIHGAQSIPQQPVPPAGREAHPSPGVL